MSRIGRAPIAIPNGVTVKLENNVVTVKGPKGELVREFNQDMIIEVEENGRRSRIIGSIKSVLKEEKEAAFLFG